MSPFHPDGRERAVHRGRRILDLLRERGDLGPEEHELACRQIEALRIPPVQERPESVLHAVLYLDEQLRRDGRRKTLGRAPVLRTTLDLDVQEEVSWMALRAVEAWEGQGAGNASVIVLERASRDVLAWVGSTDYFDARHAGAIDYARVPRSPGSTLKPFVYALALERGVITPATVLDDLDRGPGASRTPTRSTWARCFPERPWATRVTSPRRSCSTEQAWSRATRCCVISGFTRKGSRHGATGSASPSGDCQ